MTRQLFSIVIIDADCKEREFGPIALDMPDHGLSGWDAVAADETEAKEMIKADLTAKFYIP